MSHKPWSHTRDRQRPDVAVLLACGCTVKRRIRALNHHSKFPCPSNMSHGYNVAWASYTDPTMGSGLSVNRNVPELVTRPVDDRLSESVRFEDVRHGDLLRFGTFRSAYKRTDWREGRVSVITARAVTVECDGGGRAYLTAKRWSVRGVTRLAG